MRTLIAIVILYLLIEQYIIATREPVRCDGGEPGA